MNRYIIYTSDLVTQDMIQEILLENNLDTVVKPLDKKRLATLTAGLLTNYSYEQRAEIQDLFERWVNEAQEKSQADSQ